MTPDSLTPPAKKELLILTCVHGNEDFANKPVSVLQQEYGDLFDWLVGNPEALTKRVRYTEVDMNRVAPGSPDDPRYEARRAAEVLQIAQQYPFVIDIHGSTANCGVFTIVPGAPLTLQRLALATALPIDNIVIWADEAERQSGSGPLTPFMPCGVAIECGPKNSPLIANTLYNCLRSIISDGIELCMQRAQPKNLFRVYGSLKTVDVPPNMILQDFIEVRIGSETFYPLLTGQYDTIACYKMERIDLWQMFSYQQGHELRESS